MISEEKLTHILHLMIRGLKNEGFAKFTNEETAIREGRLVCNKFLVQLNQVAETVRKRIESMKNAPQEHTTQWDNIYHKFYEEEMAKIGG